MNGKRPGGWVAPAWRWYGDPKFDGLSAEAVVLWINALCHCGEQETDGIVRRSVVPTLVHQHTKRAGSVAQALVKAGLWIEVDVGYAFPPEAYSRWQQTAEQRAEGRAKAAERQARWRERHAVSDASRNASSNGTAGVVAGAGAVRSTKSPAPRAPHGAEIDHQFPEGQDPDVIVDDDGRWWVTLPDDSPDGAA